LLIQWLLDDIGQPLFSEKMQNCSCLLQSKNINYRYKTVNYVIFIGYVKEEYVFL